MEKRPIVVGVDGSDGALEAVRWATGEAILRSTWLQILCCADDDLITLSDYSIPDQYFDILKDRAKKDLAEANSVALSEALGAGTDLRIETKLLLCDPRTGLRRLSETAQLLVLGAHGDTRRVSGLLGSVADALSTRASCPVVVVRTQPEPERQTRPNTVVVGVDGSSHSRLAVDIAYEEASIRDAKLVAIHAWNFRRLHSLFTALPTMLSWKDARIAEEVVLAETLAGQREQYPDLEVSHQVVNSDPVAALREQAADACLLVVGSRGRSDFTTGMLGSTSRALLHSAVCPVLIARS